MVNEKETVSLSVAYRLLHPMHVALVSCVGKDGKPNIITLAWVMPTSIRPPMVAISVGPARYSHALIEETGEFTVNIPTIDMLKETVYCGSVSGRNRNKFEEAGLTPLPSRKVKPPAIKECIAHLECKLHSKLPTGDHTIFAGEVVEAYADNGIFNGEVYDIEKAKMIYHVGGAYFATLQPKIMKP